MGRSRVFMALRQALVVLLWVALASSSVKDQGEDLVASMDAVDIDSILKPNLQDPVNVMERNIRASLESAEDQVEVDMPKRLTNADTALEHMTDIATRVKLQQQGKIQDALMKKQMPQAPQLGEAQVEKPEQVTARDDHIRSEVFAAIDPDMRASLKQTEAAGSSSYQGMEQMIETAMTSKMKSLGQSAHQNDQLGEGIESYINQKKDQESDIKAKAKARVNIQLAHAMKKLQQAQGIVQLLELKEDPYGGGPHVVPPSTIVIQSSDTPANSTEITPEIDAEIEMIRNHNLTSADLKATEVKKIPFRHPKPEGQ